MRMWLIRVIAGFLHLPYSVTELSDGIHAPRTIEVTIARSIAAMNMARKERSERQISENS